MAYADPHDPRGRAAKRKHYQANKSDYIARSRALESELLELVRTAKSRPCADCGTQYPYWVMQFDHLGDKVDLVGSFVKRGNRSGLIAEMAKCDVVCANCHADRTHRRLTTEHGVDRLRPCEFVTRSVPVFNDRNSENP